GRGAAWSIGRRFTPSRNKSAALFGLTRMSSPLSRLMSALFPSSIAFMIPSCTPMSTTANPIPAANRANRTRSWARFFQAKGTERTADMGFLDSEQIGRLGGVDLADRQHPRGQAHAAGQGEHLGGHREGHAGRDAAPGA